MVVSSSLKKNRYSPLHGDFWNNVLHGRIRDRNPFNCDIELQPVTSKKQLVHDEQPGPRWSTRKVADWLQRKIRDGDDLAVHCLRSCIEHVVPVPSLSANANGLYPTFANDIFGIAGTSGLSQWIMDSGATSHCTSDISVFTSLSKNVPFNKIRVANGKYAKVVGIGTVTLRIIDSQHRKRSITIHMKNVLYIPELPVNLISTRSLWNDAGISSTFTDCCTLTFKDQSSVSFKTGNEGHYYCMATTIGATNETSPEPVDFGNVLCTVCEPSAFAAHPITSDVVHARLGHCGPERAVETLRNSIGLPELPHYRKELHEHCDGCRMGGARKTPLHGIPKQFQPKVFGDRIHSDLCGPFPISLTGKFVYILCFVDNATGYSEISLLQSKLSSEVKPHFERFVKKWKDKLPNGVVNEWFTDNGGEFFSDDISDFCDEFVTKRGFTVPHRSPQNAQAERLWGILQRCMRIMLAHSGLPLSLWHYAAKQANELHNLLPRHSNPDHKSPHEMVHGTKPDFSHVRVWGCLAYATILNEADRDTRVSPTAVKAVHLGRDERRRGWIVYIPSLNRITSTRDVTFDERKFLRFDQHGNVADDSDKFTEDDTPRRQAVRVYNDTLQPAHWSNPLPTQQQQPHQTHTTHLPQPQQSPAQNNPGWGHADATNTHFSSQQCSDPNCNIPSINGNHAGPHSFELNLPRSRHSAHATFPYDPDAIYFTVPSPVEDGDVEEPTDQTWSVNTDKLGEVPVPNNYDEAMASRFSHQWKEAMAREIRELLGRNTWEPVHIPTGRKATQSRWVFAIKYKSDGTIDRFKARFVVKGFSQIPGVDYESSFSSTMRATTFRTLVALAANRGLRAEHIDISNAFCQADIDGVDIYVQPPRGFEHLCSAGQGLKLLKALYGTKQASYLWQQTLSKWLVENGFTRLETDPCVFTKTVNGKQIIVGCYVDDLVVLHDATTHMFRDFRDSFLRRFDGKHLGPLEWFLGVKVRQLANGDFHLDQTKYINDLLNKFIPNSDAVAFGRKIPYPVSGVKELHEASSDSEIERVKALPYLQLVGALLYLSTMTRPDIAYYMSVLCSFMQNPSLKCYEAAQSVLLYVGHTRQLSLHYSKTYYVPECFRSWSESIHDNCGVYAYSDASWTAPKSTCGYSVFMSGGPITWSSRKLNVIADSSALAEYSAASATSKELAFVRNILGELHVQLKGPFVLAVDNTAAIKISEQRGVTKLTKHFDFAAYRIRDEVERQRVRCVFVDTYDQTADVLTKALSDYEFMRHRDKYFA
jgi:hypothetical protein